MKQLFTLLILLLFHITVPAQPWKLIQETWNDILNGDTISTNTLDYYYSNNSNRYGLLPPNHYKSPPLTLQYFYESHLFSKYTFIECDSMSHVITRDDQSKRFRLNIQSFYPDGKIQSRQLYENRDYVSDWGLVALDSFFYTDNNLTTVKSGPDPTTKQNDFTTLEYIYDSNNNLVQQLEWAGGKQANSLSRIRTITYDASGKKIQDSSSHLVAEYASGSSHINRYYWRIYRDYHFEYDSITGYLTHRHLICNYPPKDACETISYAYNNKGQLISDSTFVINYPNEPLALVVANNYYYDSDKLIKKITFKNEDKDMQTTYTDVTYTEDYQYNSEGLISRVTYSSYSQKYGDHAIHVRDYKYCHDSARCRPAAIIPTLNEIKVYPNPVTNLMVIDATFDTETFVKVDITTMTGHSVLKFEDKNVLKYHKLVDTRSLSKGLHFVYIETKQGTVSKRILVQ